MKTTLLGLIAVLTLLAVPATAAEPTVSDLVREASAMLQPAAAQHKVALKVTTEGHAPTVGTADILRERVVNLLANAVAIAPSGSIVCVTLREERLVIHVKNPAVRVTADREVCDSTGTYFLVRSIASVGTDFRITLREDISPTAITQRD
ncbi:MAG: hypothetical protein FJX76_11245 [Armatimonadetes bacterium]|nr:hypothetical protein [Armatimonadota bacterium]